MLLNGMKQEDKELLLKDLCARIPYKVKIEVTYSKESGSSLRTRLCSEGINTLDTNILGLLQQSEVYIKPYLFPLSSMTEEQKREYNRWKHEVPVCRYEYGDIVEEVELFDSPESFEYLIENHFDYRGLIEKGLAINATKLNIY